MIQIQGFVLNLLIQVFDLMLFWIYKPETRGRIVDAVNTEIYKQFKSRVLPFYPTMNVVMPKRETELVTTTTIRKDNLDGFDV